MSIEGEVDNEITQNPDRFKFQSIKDRRSAELKHYDDFFGVDDIEELDNESEAYFDGFF